MATFYANDRPKEARLFGSGIPRLLTVFDGHFPSCTKTKQGVPADRQQTGYSRRRVSSNKKKILKTRRGQKKAADKQTLKVERVDEYIQLLHFHRAAAGGKKCAADR